MGLILPIILVLILIIVIVVSSFLFKEISAGFLIGLIYSAMTIIFLVFLSLAINPIEKLKKQIKSRKHWITMVEDKTKRCHVRKEYLYKIKTLNKKIKRVNA